MTIHADARGRKWPVWLMEQQLLAKGIPRKEETVVVKLQAATTTLCRPAVGITQMFAGRDVGKVFPARGRSWLSLCGDKIKPQSGNNRALPPYDRAP